MLSNNLTYFNYEKKIFLYCSICYSSSLCRYFRLPEQRKQANVEALAEFESTITCDSGRCGQCFKEEKAWPFYKCNWTGVQADYCDCDKTGWI